MSRFLFWRKPGREAGDAKSPPRSPHSDPTGLLTGDPAQDVLSLEILLDSIAEVNSSIELGQVLQDIVDRSLEVTKAERGLLLLGNVGEELTVRVARDKDGTELGSDVRYSQTLVQRCLETGHAERSVVQSDQEALELGQSVFNLKLRAVMCAPLRVRERRLGVIYVDSTAVRREFSGRDLAVFEALSVQLASAIENARLHADSLEKARLAKDAEIAKRIQRHLMAPVPRDYRGADLAVRFIPLESASGDTYDFIPLRDGRLVALIGDVMGHGVGAALITHAAQSAVRTYFELIDDLSQVATRLNDRLARSVEAGHFMSLLMVLIDPERLTMHFVNAGHSGVMLVRRGEVSELERTGMVMGVVEGQRYDAAGPIALAPGDLLFFRTDGVEETRSPQGEVFGEARIRTTLAQVGDCSADEVLGKVSEALRVFSCDKEPDDDLTMVAIRIRAR
ncbi:MAG: SpoIIE family protein phosphatase [Planctomycetes bacterium]|nr:SpoIIE family protein phosphatase [Planctomycetota bacterium]